MSDDARMNSGRVHGVVPLARKLGKDRNIALTQLIGSGTQGRIVVKDVRAPIETPDTTPTATATSGQASAVATGAEGMKHQGESGEKGFRLREIIAKHALLPAGNCSNHEDDHGRYL